MNPRHQPWQGCTLPLSYARKRIANKVRFRDSNQRKNKLQSLLISDRLITYATKPLFKLPYLMKKLFLTAILILATSCVETVIVGSAVTGTLVIRDKTMENTKSDISISTELGVKFLENGLKNPGNSIDVTVNEGRVLLTGLVRNPDKATLAGEIAWKVSGVKEVIDEVQLSQSDHIRPRDITNAAADYLITAQIEAKLLFSKRITSVNYQITTVAGTVYLLGVANSDEELQKVSSIISKNRGVKKVVNHAILIGDARRR